MPSVTSSETAQRGFNKKGQQALKIYDHPCSVMNVDSKYKGISI
jgi:hypothetical protein